MNQLQQVVQFAIEKSATTLLNHFKNQYGSLIFLPLWVNDQTPHKIAPQVAESIFASGLLTQKADWKYLLSFTDEKVWIVYDSFLTSFIDTLNFIAKGVMSTLGMKMFWSDFARLLGEKKATNPATYEKRKTNLKIILNTCFVQLVTDLQSQGLQTEITNGETLFPTVNEASSSLRIFQ